MRKLLSILLMLSFIIPLFSPPSFAENQETIYDNFAFVGQLHNNRAEWYSLYSPSFNSTILANGSHCFVSNTNIFPIGSTHFFNTSVSLRGIQILTNNNTGTSLLALVLGDESSSFQIGFGVKNDGIYVLRKIGIDIMTEVFLKTINDLEIVNLTYFHQRSEIRLLINNIEYYWEVNSLFDVNVKIAFYSVSSHQELSIAIDSVSYLFELEEITEIDYYYLLALQLSIFAMLFSLTILNCHSLKYKNKYLHLLFLLFIPILSYSLFIFEVSFLIVRTFLLGFNMYINTKSLIKIVFKKE